MRESARVMQHGLKVPSHVVCMLYIIFSTDMMFKMFNLDCVCVLYNYLHKHDVQLRLQLHSHTTAANHIFMGLGFSFRQD